VAHRACTIVRKLVLAPTLGILAGLAGCFDDGADSSGNPDPPPAGNDAPTISGYAPSAARVAEPYTFRPVAYDADGDALQFRGDRLPQWMSLDPTSGRLTGTPQPGDEGTYGGISIEVSDGWSRATLGPFSITVNQMATGTATLSWQAPTSNADGSPLTNLAGYRIIYGREARDLDQSVQIDNPSISTYVVERLSPGTWYFAVIAVNRYCLESVPSGLGSKSIN
jgi:Putative Ig domain